MRVRRHSFNPDSYQIGETESYVQDGRCGELEQIVIDACRDELHMGEFGTVIIWAALVPTVKTDG